MQRIALACAGLHVNTALCNAVIKHSETLHCPLPGCAAGMTGTTTWQSTTPGCCGSASWSATATTWRAPTAADRLHGWRVGQSLRTPLSYLLTRHVEAGAFNAGRRRRDECLPIEARTREPHTLFPCGEQEERAEQLRSFSFLSGIVAGFAVASFLQLTFVVAAPDSPDPAADAAGAPSADGAPQAPAPQAWQLGVAITGGLTVRHSMAYQLCCLLRGITSRRCGERPL